MITVSQYDDVCYDCALDASTCSDLRKLILEFVRYRGYITPTYMNFGG